MQRKNATYVYDDLDCPIPWGHTDSNGLTNGNELIDVLPTTSLPGKEERLDREPASRGGSLSRPSMCLPSHGSAEGPCLSLSGSPVMQRFLFEVGYAKWRYSKLLAVGVILTLLLSSIILLTDTHPEDRIVIDGRFSDWDGIMVIDDRISNSYPDIVRCGIHSDGIFDAFYLETGTRLLEGLGSRDDILRIFIDSDGDPKTGYSIRTMGADHLVEIHGRDNHILGSWYYSYDIDHRSPIQRSDHDWNAWSQMFEAEAAVRGNKFEARLWSDELVRSQEGTLKVLFHLSTASGNDDSSYIISLRGALTYSSRSLITSPVLQPGIEYPVLDVTFRNVGSGGVSINSISFTSFSTLHDTEIASSILHSDASAADFHASIQGGRLFFTTEEDLTDSVDRELRYTLSVTLTHSVVYGHALVVGITSIDSAAGITPIHEELARAYAGAVPGVPVVDGIFSEWEDPFPDRPLDCDDGSIDILSHGSVAVSDSAFFYTSVRDDLLQGRIIHTRSILSMPSPSSRDQGISYQAADRAAPPLPVMSGEDVLYLFLNTNGSSGYRSYPGFLADHMVEIRGRAGSVTSAIFHSFSGSSHGDWAWSRGEEISAALFGSQIELSIPLASVDRYHLHLVSWEGISDWTDPYQLPDHQITPVDAAHTRSDETDLCINEIFPNPTNESREWVELFNPTSEDIDLEGWELRDESGTIWEGTAGEEVLTGEVFLIPLNNKLRNSGEKIILHDPQDTILDEVRYPTYTSYEGLAHARIYDASEYFERDPTPTKNALNACDDDIVINEIYYDVTGSEPQDEFIELYNRDGSSRTLTNWSLRNDDRESFNFTTTIAGEGFHVIDDQDTDLDGQSYTDCFGTYGLSGSEDFVVLENPDGQVVDRITYASDQSSDYFNDSGSSVGYADSAPDVEEGNSLGRYPDGNDTGNDGDDFHECTNTKGSENTPLIEVSHALMPISGIIALFTVFRKRRKRCA